MVQSPVFTSALHAGSLPAHGVYGAAFAQEALGHHMALTDLLGVCDCWMHPEKANMLATTRRDVLLSQGCMQTRSLQAAHLSCKVPHAAVTIAPA